MTAVDEGVWDVAIVGAGPAGSAAALAALAERPAARVLLIDRATFPRDKSCGDGIAPHVLDVLGPLGAGNVVTGWEPLQHLTLSRRSQAVHGHMARPGWVIPREVFDARLVDQAVTAGAHLVQHRVRNVHVDADTIILDERFKAHTVVAADGAHSAIRASLPGHGQGRRAIAIRGYAPTPPSRAGRQVIRFGEGRPQPSYAWSFDRGDGLSNVGYGELLEQDARPARAQLLGQLEALLPGSVADGHQWLGHILPLSGWGWRREQPDGPILFAGDAAGLINPMTGEGIYYAVATGASAGRNAIRAAEARRPMTAGTQHRAEVRGLLNRHLRHTWTAARLTTRPVVVEAGLDAATRDQRTFDDLVELGLGGGLLTPHLVGSLAVSLIRNQLTSRSASRYPT